MSSRSLGPTLIAVGFGIIVVPFLVMFVLAIGPFGWVLLGGAVIVLGIVISLRESAGYDDVDRTNRTNCDDCGARIDADADTCEYCGAAR
ncbi:hypothetical protein E2L06_08110 [Haloterrigena sp. H1]|uniref:hypothetical protein n=1 Tax=Haloterrigena sp. H1 TaxID=2552943 RepID=UPI00110E6357|nr:hypothetical protein [Haloterrigena sp. H1]TMT86568.1 hypothetical protein E2L06_08110 [Haloterrigena sp. H1]